MSLSFHKRRREFERWITEKDKDDCKVKKDVDTPKEPTKKGRKKEE